MVLTKHLNGRQVHTLLNITLDGNHSFVLVHIMCTKMDISIYNILMEKYTLQYINEKIHITIYK